MNQPAPVQDNPPTGQQTNTMALLVHASGIFTLFGLIASLIVWLLNKDKPEQIWLSNQSKEAFNGILTIFLILIALYIVVFILAMIGLQNSFFMRLPYFGWIGGCVMLVSGGLKARKDPNFKYTNILRVLK